LHPWKNLLGIKLCYPATVKQQVVPSDSNTVSFITLFQKGMSRNPSCKRFGNIDNYKDFEPLQAQFTQAD